MEENLAQVCSLLMSSDVSGWPNSALAPSTTYGTKGDEAEFRAPLKIRQQVQDQQRYLMYCTPYLMYLFPGGMTPEA